MQDMKKTIRFFLVLTALMIGAAGEVKAIIATDIHFNYDEAKGSASVKADDGIISVDGGTKVTIVAIPKSGYSISAGAIIAEKMVDPTNAAPRRTSGLSESLLVTDEGSNNFSFVIPTGYAGAYVTVNFYETPSGDFIAITSLSEIPNTTEGLAGKYVLAGDINASGNMLGEFKGELNGNNHTIYGLQHPLFSSTDGEAKIYNLNFEDVNINVVASDGTDGDAGVITAKAKGATRIYNCGILPSAALRDADNNVTGFIGCSVGGSRYVGGFVGFLDEEARVINCFSYANITGGTNVGGIVGYNNVATASNNLKTMVMNCMFYGDITGGDSKAPIYNGKIISNAGDKGVGNYNYFRLEAPYVQPTGVTYNCALGAEDRFLNRFEFYRHLLNSHRELAGWWATGTYSGEAMLKWVLEPSQLGTATPYPILKESDKYPSVVNIDVNHSELYKGRDLTVGRKLGTLTVNIQMGNGAVYNHPGTGDNEAKITTPQLTLNITDKDPDHFNFNYYKVQLPYYNDVGTKNYTGNRVVTGWKIVSITDGTAGTYSTGEDVTYTDGVLTATPYNFADRNCTNKDLYSVSGRVFNQGAYWDVPYGVTAITIEPYWAKCAYVADAYPDVVYNTAMTSTTNVPNVGGGQKYTNGNSYSIAGESQKVFTTKGNATSSSNSGLFQGVTGTPKNQTVYDYAVVLVGNYHNYNDMESSMDKPYTITSVDLDGDNEPDYSYILRFDSRKAVHPARVDFINIPGLGMAQKSTGGTGSYNFGIMQPKGWFESTNTSLFRVTQFEYDNSSRVAAPYILQGGVMEQWVNGQSGGHANKTTYFHVGGNVWFKEFHRGTHQDAQYDANHSPVSVTGGDFDQFHLTGLYRADVTIRDDNAECYITGGRFGVVAGTGMDGIGHPTNHTNGNITWIIDNADIKEFYAGSFNADKPAQGNLHTIVNGGHIDLFCGGPKFGDMNPGRTVTTTATGCTFGTFFGAGYGGNSYSRQAPYNHSSIVNFPHNQSQAGNDASWNAWLNRFYKQEYNSEYGGVSTQFSYQFLPMSDNKTNVARIFVEYVKFSKATTKSVTSNLTGCTITGNFYGGGNLGKVEGPVNSTLTNCTVNGNVFGAGFSGNLPIVEVDDPNGFEIEPYYYEALGTYRTGKKGATTTYTWDHADAISIDKTKKILYTTENLNDLGTVSGNVTLNILGDNTVINGDVYGGGAEAKSNTDYYKDSSPVTTTKTTVNLIGGKIMGDVYGGGLGRLAKAAVGTPGTDDYQAAVEKVEAHVGNTVVNLNGISATEYASNTALYSTWGLAPNGETWVAADETNTENETTTIVRKGCIIAGTNVSPANNHGRIFGCNNLMGTPKGSATVNIYKTNGFEGHERTPSNKLDNIDDNQHSYEVQAVYGGGNLAAYEPNAPIDKHTQVNIYGCGDTSIKQVYGGGNAASTPATQVDVYGTYEIEEIFGGGNGKDDISKDGGTTFIKNPGANVGFKDYWDYENEKDMEAYDTKDKRQDEDFINNYVYGSGEAHVNIHGGKTHRVYGGSNTKGNVKAVAVTMLEEASGCDFNVDEAYGGGKSAPMDGASKLEMACIPGLKNAYGGAEEADIQSDVTLTITNGNFDRVFGGNNVSGTIHGKITVNIEETGCHLITIGQLYGGGNQAAYTGPWKDDNDHSKGRQGPTVNAKSFTSIGDVYGGGYGKTATVEGDTEVNINVCDGKYFGGSQQTEEDRAAIATNWKYIDNNNNIKDVTENPGYKTITFSEYVRTDDGGFVDEDHDGNRDVVEPTPTITVFYPKHTTGKIGGVNNVYGGGNAAMVQGNTTVNIGTNVEVYMADNSVNTGDNLGNDHYTLDTDGEYKAATGNAIDGTTYYKKYTVKGASITGNVYGGGNAAKVTGRTNVNIGKKEGN